MENMQTDARVLGVDKKFISSKVGADIVETITSLNIASRLKKDTS